MSDPTDGWAKATEAVSEMAKDAILTGRDAGRFLAPIFKPLVEATGDRLEIWKATRQLRLADRWMAMLRDRGLDSPTRPIPPAFLLPLIEHASLEGDDDLQDVWATMLANAADRDSETEMRTAFLTMLREMTHFDVSNIAKLAEADSSSHDANIATGDLP